jgi:transcriptional regulator with XRE-family HTH domain
MGRPPKNPTNVLVRLRGSLSTDGQTVTRKLLAERVGVSPSTIREIENDRFQLTEEVAQKMFRGTGVDPASLLRGDNPLLDVFKKPVGPDSKKMASNFWIPDYGETDEFLLSALLRAAEKRGTALSVSTGFFGWLEKTARFFGLVALVSQELTENLESFNMSLVPDCFRPKDPKSERIWAHFKQELSREHKRIAAELRAAHDPRIDAQPPGMVALTDSRFVDKLARQSLKERKEQLKRSFERKPRSKR